MTSNQSVLVLAVGFMLAFGGVGGIENSETTDQMIGSAILAVLGLLAMYAGVLGLQNSDYYDAR